MTRLYRSFFLVVVFFVLSCTPPARVLDEKNGWPPVSNETKPWTRWWWQGSALTREGITAEMEAYHAAGIGGLEITPIYGVYGEEEAFIDFLSPEWIELLKHVLSEARRLDMGIDMATGTGWPFGGPWVSDADACKNLRHKVYEVSGGATLTEKIEFIQQPYLRLVGNHLYTAATKVEGVDQHASKIVDSRTLRIADLINPVHKNPNLQALAIDQVQFEKPLALKVLMAYGPDRQILDLTDKVSAAGNVDWTAPAGEWKLYVVFEGYHGKMVERAGPGGEGNVIDHFSTAALDNYLKRFDDAFKGHDISSLRAFFNDSYEVDDARGSADFTPALFDEFKKRRGYDLRHELPAFFGQDTSEKNARVLCDYRETLSELLLDNFTVRWKAWANAHGAMVRNQAHGSPANILDLYAVVDIPEIEGTEPLRFKMATSSGNVSGKKLVSAEAATWLDEHFESGLGDIKNAMDQFMLHGVNHLVYHGTCYSPPGEPWPGRLFYAAVHMNPRNPMWRDAAALNTYLTRCQSFLQNTSADNDVLLYYPVYDRFSAPGREMVEHFDGIGRSFAGSSFEKCANIMLERGFAFDYISDKQITESTVKDGSLKTSGGGSYKTLVIPGTVYMPLATLEKILALARDGAQVIFVDAMPSAASGYADVTAQTKKFQEAIAELTSLAEGKNRDKRNVQAGSDLISHLATSGIEREAMVDAGVQCLRKKGAAGRYVYFIKNIAARSFEGFLPLRTEADDVIIYDPMTGDAGRAKIRNVASQTSVFIQLEVGQTLILEAHPQAVEESDFRYREIAGDPVSLKGQWKITFDSGGPELPEEVTTDSAVLWTGLKADSYTNFSGTATYETMFDQPDSHAGRWLLNLGAVHETAEVFLNGESLGTLIGPVYAVEIDSPLRKEANVLQVKVSNLMANRIAWLDRNNVFWKKFYNINFPARLRENARDGIFDASHWQPRPSGISGPVRLYPLK